MSESPAMLVRVAALSLVAGLLHGIVAPAHFDEWWGYGLFFLFASLAQSIYGAALLLTRLVQGAWLTELTTPSQRRTFYLAGIVGNVAIVALYVVTRTVGIPFFGPEAGAVEEVRALDVASKLVEAALVVLLWRLVVLSRRSPA